jgi:O-antigen/teichoic acid export membrane protein
MQSTSRLQATMKNAIVGVVGQFFTFTLQFASRTIFINLLGSIYLGLNGLFTNILSVLSLAELGVGYAITFSLYKPIADKNINKIQALMNLYKKIYRIIGLTVLVLGLALTPFLDNLIMDKPSIPNLWFIYLLFLANSVSTYFFAYKRSIIIADQKNYIITINNNIFALLINISQILILLVSSNFIFYLLVQIILSIISNIIISIKADRLYPYIKGKNSARLDDESKVDIVKKMRAMAYHQIGAVVVTGTDNILISSFIGVHYVGLYSNYLLIISVVNAFINQVLNSVTASVGNLTASESVEKNFKVFHILFFGTFLVYGFSSICLFTLLNNFISLWIGPDYIFSKYITMLIVLNFYLMGMRNSVNTFKNALGLYYQDRYKPIFESIINLVASVILLKLYGLSGVFLGTLISTITTCLWIEPYILYKYYFKKPLTNYFKQYLIYFSLTVLVAFLTYTFSELVYVNTLLSFLIVSLFTVFIAIAVFSGIFYKTQLYKFYYETIKKILNRKRQVVKS